MAKSTTDISHGVSDEVIVELTPEAERNAAAELAQRIEFKLVDPSIADEADRQPEDRPPGYADALMSEAPSSIERAADLNSMDWELIAKALEHYAACTTNC